mgnify:CR=1 FL=1
MNVDGFEGGREKALRMVWGSVSDTGLASLCAYGGVRPLPLLFNCDGTGDAQIPFRRPSGIAVEGVERHGCRESCDGPGMALRQWAASGRAPGAVMERGNSGAAGAVCRGVFLCLLSLHKQRK